MDSTLYLRTFSPIRAQNAGLFISRGTSVHPTRVISTHELIFVREGELDMREEDQYFHLEAGQTLHLFPGREHGGTRPLAPGLRFYWIHFEVEEENRKAGLRPPEEFLPTMKVPQTSFIRQPERLERLFRTFLDDQETGMLHPYSASLLTMMMLIEVTQAAVEKPDNPGDLNVVATWAHTYIRINYERPITASKVAEALGYNTDYLGRIYRGMYGCTLTEAIHRRRIGKACDFLMDKTLTIEQIAPMCGFSDPDYFRRVFRKYMKVAPGDYRNEYSHMHVNTH